MRVCGKGRWTRSSRTKRSGPARPARRTPTLNAQNTSADGAKGIDQTAQRRVAGTVESGGEKAPPWAFVTFEEAKQHVKAKADLHPGWGRTSSAVPQAMNAEKKKPSRPLI